MDRFLLDYLGYDPKLTIFKDDYFDQLCLSHKKDAHWMDVNDPDLEKDKKSGSIYTITQLADDFG